MSKGMEDRVRELEDAFITLAQYVPQVKELKTEVTKLKSYFDSTCERRTRDHKDELEHHVSQIDNDTALIHVLIEKRTTQFTRAFVVLLGLGLSAVVWVNSGFKEKDNDNKQLIRALAALTTEVRVMNEVVMQTKLIVLGNKESSNLRISK